MSASPLRCAARLLTAALVGAGVLVPGAAAAADDAPGPGTVVGELVQAYPEDTGTRAGGGHTDAPLSWVRTAAGQSVRVPTDDVADLPAGSKVSVAVGGKVRDAASGAGYGPATAVQSAAVLDRRSSSPPAPPGDAPGGTNQGTPAPVGPRGAAA